VKVTFDSQNLVRQLNNVTEYSLGFLEGVQAAKPEFLDNLGKSVIESNNSIAAAEVLDLIGEVLQK
jgi:hypothetical protein